MASLTIRTRQTKSGPSYAVRYRLGGRAYPLVHGGSFATLREAKVRRDLIGGEIAAGRNPADLLRTIAETPAVARTLADYADAYRASRIDIAGRTAKSLASHLAAIVKTLGERDPATLTAADVQTWVGGLELSPTSISRYLSTLRAVLDFADVDPNPTRDPRVRLPRVERPIVEPPSSSDVDAIIASVGKTWRLPLRVLEQTGLRVGELQALEWRDVDVSGSRFRIRAGKTAAARRWAQVPVWLMDEIVKTCPPDDRVPERRVFIGFKADSLADAMRRACKTVGIAHYHPHDFRHRYASVKIAEGVPVTTVAAQLGHSKKSLTLDTYSHVLLDG